MPYLTISLGGVTLGVGIIVLSVMRWVMREKKRIGALVPFVLSVMFGMLCSLAALGGWSVLGAVTWVSLWAGQLAGYAGLVYGVGGNSPNVTRAHPVVLTDGGYAVFFLFTLVVIGLLKWGPKQSAVKILFGCLAGILVALSGNVAGVAAVPLASGVNALGVPFTRMFG